MKRIIKFLKEKLRPFNDQYWYKLLRGTYKELTQIEIGMLPSYIAYFLLFAFVPTVSIVVQIISLFMFNIEELMAQVETYMPEYVQTVIKTIIVGSKGQDGRLFTFFNIFLYYLASRGYYAIYNSYAIIYHIECKINPIKDRLLALINTIVITVVLLGVLSLYIFGDYLFTYVLVDLFNISEYHILFDLLTLVLSIIGVIIIVLIVMKSMPNKKQSFKEIYPGAIFTTLGWLIASYLFKVYVDGYANYQNYYGTFTTVIIFLTWLFMISQIAVIGMIMNHVRENLSMNDPEYSAHNTNGYIERSECS
ncbi:YihY/virulence factor BrkB family protein [Haloplasma contractile]|uniref:Ribonuclease BN protein n=1 Tax=Haloplasma contractile SSD-17B TaxID=1033810 RepID=U2FPR5_9MOLU|nr:YihY/virulence factor BrkB family protein [Haloplasma contractile]ERJ13029.1 ribonuclease BN protein [Haloplasma contractile SSD-17B]